MTTSEQQHLPQSDPGYIEFLGDRLMFGGPFFDAPRSPEFLCINLMKEHPELPSEIYIPIQDYSIPHSIFPFVDAFERIRADHRDVFVGCFGGKGRTGLFMACFLKYLGDENALQTVRECYNPHAVETPEQVAFLANFPIAPSLRPPRPR